MKTFRVPRKDKKKIQKKFFDIAKKRGLPCKTKKQKRKILRYMSLAEPKKIKLHDWSHGYESNLY